MVAVGDIRNEENLPLVVFVDGCVLFGGDIRLLSQVNQNVPRVFLRVSIHTSVLVLEELCVRSTPFRAQPQAIAMLARNVLEGDKEVKSSTVQCSVQHNKAAQCSEGQTAEQSRTVQGQTGAGAGSRSTVQESILAPEQYIKYKSFI